MCHWPHEWTPQYPRTAFTRNLKIILKHSIVAVFQSLTKGMMFWMGGGGSKVFTLRVSD